MVCFVKLDCLTVFASWWLLSGFAPARTSAPPETENAVPICKERPLLGTGAHYFETLKDKVCGRGEQGFIAASPLGSLERLGFHACNQPVRSTLSQRAVVV